MKNPAFAYCPCCGYFKRYKGQKRLYKEILRREADEAQMMRDHGIALTPLPRPDWKSVNNPRRDDRFILGLQAKKDEDVTPHELRQRHKQRHVRRQAAQKRKQMRQWGELPHMM